jgi:hypothetical protein
LKILKNGRKKAIKQVIAEIELEDLLRGARERRHKAQRLFHAALTSSLVSPGKKVREHLGIRSAFPEAEVEVRPK